jgi:hypothetical protein
LTAFNVTESGRIGWARKTGQPTEKGLLSRLLGR